jgi:membrane protease YdiL (CAAX protease family)
MQIENVRGVLGVKDYWAMYMKNPATFPATADLRSGLAVRMPTGARWILETLNRIPRAWLAMGGILVAGNVANALSWRFAVPINTGAFSVSLAIGLYAMPGWGEWRRSRTTALAWRPSWRHTMLAIAAGLALAAPSVLFFALASARGGVGYNPIPALPVPSLIMRELVEIPLLTALVEELVFRQYAFRAFAKKGVVATVLVNAGIFTLWHLVVTARTVLSTHFAASPLLTLGAYVGSLGTIFAAGVVFALVRWRTGSFAYSALTHWVVLGITTLAVWAL